MLTPVILSRLPQEIRLEWSKESFGHEGDLKFLLTFLQKEIQLRERSETFKEISMEKNVRREPTERRRVGSASALQTSSEEGPPQCAFCQKRHKSEKYWNMLKLDKRDREEKVKEAGCVLSVFIKVMYLKVVKVRSNVLSVMGHIMCCFVTWVSLILKLIKIQVSKISVKAQMTKLMCSQVMCLVL